MRQSDVLKHLFAAPTIFAAIVGAPSILLLLEIVLDRDVLLLLHWIVDSYERLMTVLTALTSWFVVPLTLTIIAIFSADLHLGEQWRPIFVLLLIFVFPNIWPYRAKVTFWGLVYVSCNVIFYVVVAVLASLVPLSPWYNQFLIAIIPVAFFWYALLEDSYVIKRRRGRKLDWTFLKMSLFLGALLCGFVVLLTLFFCLFEATQKIAALVEFAVFILMFHGGGALVAAYNGKFEHDALGELGRVKVITTGLRAVSGFLLASLIIAVDWLLWQIS